MITIPIYVNDVEQGVCELSKTRKYISEKLLPTHTLTADEVQTLQSIWNQQYEIGDKVIEDKLEYTIL